MLRRSEMLKSDMLDTNEPVDPRILFAEQRTFLAWLRTGLALMGFGFVVARFGIFLRVEASTAGSSPTGGFSQGFGVILLALGVALTGASAVQHILLVRRLARGQGVDPQPTWLGVGLAVLLVIIGTVASVYLITLG